MKIKIHKNYIRGFTLIELLVVVAIIGLLSSVVLASLSSARIKGQDSARIQDVQSLETAMELYYNDKGTYPQIPGDDVLLSDANLNAFLVPKYIGIMPAILIADADRYYDAGGGGANQYGLHVYMAGTNSWCNTGISPTMNINNWWGTNVVCRF